MDPSVASALWGALTLDGSAYADLQNSPHMFRTSVALLALIGASWTVGHSAVLFFNRVPPGRWVSKTAALACSFILGVLIWVTLTWAVTHLIPGGERIAFWKVLPIAAFGYAPLALSVLVIIPYLGTGLETVFNTWALLALVVAVSVAGGIGLIPALLCALVGWALTKVLPRLAGGRLGAIFQNAWYTVNVGQIRAQGEADAAEAVSRLRQP
jgi:hypothetical protein